MCRGSRRNLEQRHLVADSNHLREELVVPLRPDGNEVSTLPYKQGWRAISDVVLKIVQHGLGANLRPAGFDQYQLVASCLGSAVREPELEKERHERRMLLEHLDVQRCGALV